MEFSHYHCSAEWHLARLKGKGAYYAPLVLSMALHLGKKSGVFSASIPRLAGMIEAQPLSEKKGADQGIDGYIYFQDDKTGKFKKIIVQVKSGKVSSRDIRDLKGTMTREKSEISVFITLEEPTTSMTKEAHSHGFYESEYFKDRLYPRIQIISVAELFAGRRPEYPQLSLDAGYKRARPKGKISEQTKLL